MNTRIIQLSPERWQEYKGLRLEALKNDPQAFGQSYEKALDFPDSYWMNHLKDALVKDKILIYFAENEGKLIGVIGAFFHSTEETKNSAQIFGVYVNKNYRGHGIAKNLQNKLLAELKTIKGINKIKVMVNKTQISAVNLYKQGGFKLVSTRKRALGDGKEYEIETMETENSSTSPEPSPQRRGDYDRSILPKGEG